MKTDGVDFVFACLFIPPREYLILHKAERRFLEQPAVLFIHEPIFGAALTPPVESVSESSESFCQAFKSESLLI
jgi:hypothetical protein